MTSLPNENEFLNRNLLRKNSSPSPSNRRSPQWMNHIEITDRPISPARLEISEILKFDQGEEEQVEKLLESLEQEVNDLDESQKLHSIRRRKKTPSEDQNRPRSVIPRPKMIIQLENNRSSTPVLSSKTNFDIPEGIKKPTKIINTTSEQKLFTYPVNHSSKRIYFIIFIILIILLFFYLFLSKLFISSKPKSLKNFKFINQHFITNRILQNTLSCNQIQSISLLFSGELKPMSDIIDNIHFAFKNYCKKEKDILHLLEHHKEKWKDEIMNQIYKNPNTIFVFDIHEVPSVYYEFLSQIINKNEFKQSIFILLSDYGINDFVLVRKSTLDTEERDYKRCIQKQLKINWATNELEKLQSMLTNIVPIVHDHQ